MTHSEVKMPVFGEHPHKHILKLVVNEQLNSWEKFGYMLDCVYIAIYTIKCVKSAHFKLDF